MWRVGRASDEEGLRLVLAFFNIDDPRQRQRLIELAESFARETHPDYSHAAMKMHDEAVQPQAVSQDNERTPDKT